MNNKYHVDFTSFKEYRDFFEKKIEEFRNSVYRVYESCDKLEWEGEGYVATMDLVSNQINDLDVVTQILDLFKKFMDTAIDDYTEGMEEIKKSFEEILEQIREERKKRGELTDEFI